MCEKSPKTPLLSPPDDYSKLEEAQHVDFSNKNWYIITGLAERPRFIFGEEVPRFFVEKIHLSSNVIKSRHCLEN